MAETRSSTDYEIQHAVMKRLDWAADVRSEHIGVGVTDGAVTITGEVVDQKERLAAIRAASEVRGVDAVVDEIVVQWAGVVSNDVDVARKVQEAIERVQGRAPTVVGLVRNGIVTLTGVIEDDEQRVVLRDAIAAQPGIGPVVDRMSELPTPSAAEVRALVAEVLERVTHQETEGVHVEMIGHVAVIDGLVYSSHDKRAAGLAARQVPGVSDVDNRLVVAT